MEKMSFKEAQSKIKKHERLERQLRNARMGVQEAFGVWDDEPEENGDDPKAHLSGDSLDRYNEIVEKIDDHYEHIKNLRKKLEDGEVIPEEKS